MARRGHGCLHGDGHSFTGGCHLATLPDSILCRTSADLRGNKRTGSVRGSRRRGVPSRGYTTLRDIERTRISTSGKADDKLSRKSIQGPPVVVQSPKRVSLNATGSRSAGESVSAHGKRIAGERQCQALPGHAVGYSPSPGPWIQPRHESVCCCFRPGTGKTWSFFARPNAPPYCRTRVATGSASLGRSRDVVSRAREVRSN